MLVSAGIMKTRLTCLSPLPISLKKKKKKEQEASECTAAPQHEA